MNEPPGRPNRNGDVFPPESLAEAFQRYTERQSQLRQQQADFQGQTERQAQRDVWAGMAERTAQPHPALHQLQRATGRRRMAFSMLEVIEALLHADWHDPGLLALHNTLRLLVSQLGLAVDDESLHLPGYVLNFAVRADISWPHFTVSFFGPEGPALGLSGLLVWQEPLVNRGGPSGVGILSIGTQWRVFNNMGRLLLTLENPPQAATIARKPQMAHSSQERTRVITLD